MLTAYRRHLSDCPHRPKGRRWNRCACPIWVQGTLGGEVIRRSLDLTSWEAAADRVRGWDASGTIGVIKATIPTIREAVTKCLADAEARKLAPESIKKLRHTLEKRLVDLGATPLPPMTPAQFGKMMADDAAKWSKVIKSAGIKPE